MELTGNKQVKIQINVEIQNLKVAMKEKKRVLRENNGETYFRLRGSGKDPRIYGELDGASQPRRQERIC